MDLGAILLPASTAERPLAVPVEIALRITVIIAILPVRGASILTLSIAEAKPAPAAARLPRVYLKTPNAPGQRAFLRCGAYHSARRVSLRVRND